MSDTILGGDITVYYLDENRQKRFEWTGSTTGTRTANEFYSAVGTLLDEPSTGDDATAIFADTPVEYTIGAIDPNDTDPWYMSYDLAEHLTGGSFRTSGWDRVTGTNTGIVVVPVTIGTMASADLGGTMTNASDTGTLLEIINDGTNAYLVIRPTNNTTTHDWDTGSGTISSSLTANTSTQTAAALDGEQIWANYYNVTPIDGDTHVYVYAGAIDGAARSRVYSVNSTTQDYWARGSFDRLIPIRDFTTASNPLIDDGYKTLFARRGNSNYDAFEVLASTTSGGRNPVPLKASADTNHTVGWQSITLAGGSGTWSVGDEISGDTTDARGIVTIGGSGTTPTIHYYPIPHATTGVLTAFNGSEAVTDEDSGATATSITSGPDNQGPALASWFTGNVIPSVVHGATTFDVANEGTAEGYGALLDCENSPMTEVYQWSMYAVQNGITATASTDGIEGEQYQGPSVYLGYTVNDAGDLAEGDYVTQETSGATGVIVSMDETTTPNQILLRDTRGTFATGATDHTLTNASTGSIEIDLVADNFGVNTANPFGPFAGGRWFFARGVVPVNWVAGDENSWETIPSAGGEAQSRPTAIALSVSNLRGTAITDATADFVNMHRLTGSGGVIEKDRYSSTGGVALGANTVVVDTAISVDEPSAGRINLRDSSNDNKHYMIRYASWDTSTFTLAEFASFVSTATTNATQVTYATGGFNANVKRGDLVYNVTLGSDNFGYVETVDSDTQLTLVSPGIVGQTTGNNIAINVVPIDDDTADDVYPSLISEYPTSDTESVSLVYDSPIFYRVKVSNTRHTSKQRRFVTDGSTSGTDKDTPNIVTDDPIHT